MYGSMPTIMRNLDATYKQVGHVLDTSWDGTIPVDPEAIAAGITIQKTRDDTTVTHPIRVEPARLGDASGYAVMLVDEPIQAYLCAYNDDEIEWRQRFTIAHELGHILLGHVDSLGNPKRDMDFNSYGDPEEIEATAFAMGLLMPEKVINYRVRQGYGIAALSEVFNVSPTTIRFRLKELKYL